MFSPLHAKAIAVYGEVLVDEFDGIKIVGGAPFNVARHLGALGDMPVMLSAIGQDSNADLIRTEFERFGLALNGLQVILGKPTGVVTVHMQADHSHLFEIQSECAYDYISTSVVQNTDLHGWLYYGTLALRSEVSFQTWRQIMRSHVGLRYFDLNWRAGFVAVDRALLAMAEADVVKVNEEELQLLCSWSRLDSMSRVSEWKKDEIDVAIAALMRLHLIQHLIVTRGDKGYACFDSLGICRHLVTLARPVNLVDTVGAGDAFSAVTLHGLSRGWDLAVTLSRAADFASRVCEIRGAVPHQMDVYQDWTADWK